MPKYDDVCSKQPQSYKIKQHRSLFNQMALTLNPKISFSTLNSSKMNKKYKLYLAMELQEYQQP